MRTVILTMIAGLGWLLMIVAVALGLFLAMSLGSLHRIQDGGAYSARITHTMLWLLPLFIFGSAALLYSSRGNWSKRISLRLYWLLLSSQFSCGLKRYGISFSPCSAVSYARRIGSSSGGARKGPTRRWSQLATLQALAAHLERCALNSHSSSALITAPR